MYSIIEAKHWMSALASTIAPTYPSEPGGSDYRAWVAWNGCIWCPIRGPSAKPAAWMSGTNCCATKRGKVIRHSVQWVASSKRRTQSKRLGFCLMCFIWFFKRYFKKKCGRVHTWPRWRLLGWLLQHCCIVWFDSLLLSRWQFMKCATFQASHCWWL